MHEQTRNSILKAVVVVLAVMIFTGQSWAEQFHGDQQFSTGAIGSEFAVPAGSVPYWGVDGSCSPGLIYQDGLRGNNGSKCLSSNVPLGVGTRMIKDLNPGAGSSTITALGTSGIDSIHRLWVSADDGSGTNGQELYYTLGSYYPILALQTDINAGAASSSPANMYQHVPGGQRELFFSADDGTHGREVWVSNTGKDISIETVMLADLYPGPSSSNPSEFGTAGDGTINVAVFAADDGINGRELFYSIHDIDGNPVSASLLTNINPGSASSDPQDMTVMNVSTYGALAFFTADHSIYGRELWRTDGTPGGTGIVKDMVAGAVGSNPTNLTSAVMPYQGSLNPFLLFTVNSDGVNGAELWRTKGGFGGGDTVKHFDPGIAGSVTEVAAVPEQYFAISAVGNSIYAHSIAYTTPYNVLVKTFVSPPTNLVAVGEGTVYFVADDGTGKGAELWKVVVSGGGAYVNCYLVKDIRPGTASSNPQDLIEVGGNFALAADTLYFTADDGTHGRELWRSDSSAGAVLVKDINPGSAGSNPANLHDHEQLYLTFTADDGTHGRELWQSDGYETPPHDGVTYKWDLAAEIAAVHGGDKTAVIGTDEDVLSTYVLFDMPAIGGNAWDPDEYPDGHPGVIAGISEGAHQVNTYLELTDGTDRAPLNLTYVDCGDGNVLRPKAALTDGSNHNAIAFGMIAVLDQNPCDTDSTRGPNSPGVPVAYAPAVYDGYQWIPMTLANFPAGVPQEMGGTQVMGEWESEAYMATGWPWPLPPEEEYQLVPATEDPWQQKRFAWARIDVWGDYMAIFWGNHQYGRIWVATLERQYKGMFKALYIGNSACIEPAYAYYTDSVMLNGGVVVGEGSACCHANGICEDDLTEAECDGVFTPGLSCGDPGVPTCCPTPFADGDGDGDVDQVDFGLWQVCYSKDGIAYTGDCDCFDRNDSTGELGGDGDIDLTDFIWFENCFGGPAMTPACLP